MSGELSVTDQKRQHKELVSSLNAATKQLTRIADLLESLASGMYMRSNIEELLNDKEKFDEQAKNLSYKTTKITMNEKGEKDNG